jgi:ParB-like chromosome segregation protein Spo0J
MDIQSELEQLQRLLHLQEQWLNEAIVKQIENKSLEVSLVEELKKQKDLLAEEKAKLVSLAETALNYATVETSPIVIAAAESALKKTEEE